MFLQTVLTVLFAAGAVLKAGEAVLGRGDRASSVLLACSFATLAAGLALSVPTVTRVFDAAVPGAGKILYNGLTFVGLYLLVVFFLRALRGPSAAVRIRAETALLVAAVAVLVVLLALTPADRRTHSLSSPFLGEPPVLAFYVLGGAYFVHAYVAVVRLIRTYLRSTGGPLAWALWTITAGLVGLTLTSLVRIGRVVEVALGGPQLPVLNTINFQLNLISYLILSVGLVLAGWGQALVLLRARRRRRRQLDALEPLWTALTSLYPEIVLPWPDGAGRRWLPDPVEGILYRRVLECRDGLLRAGPLIAAAAGTTDLAGMPPERIAARLHELADRGAPSGAADMADPVAVASPVAPDLGGDVDALLAISAALASAVPGGARR